MDTVAYYDGMKYKQVFPIEVLLNPTMDLAKSIATGPQDEFFTALDRVNGELKYFGEDFQLFVTPSWNWKPGTIPKTKELVVKILEIEKKSQGLTGLFQRTRDRNYYLRRHERNFAELEGLKSSLKRDSYKIDVDIDKFKESMEDIVCKINSQIKLIKEMTEEKVIIETFISGLDNPRYSELHLDITLSNLTMNVFNGSSCIHNQNLEPINIKLAVPFRGFLSGLEDLKKTYIRPTIKGFYLSMLLPKEESLSNSRYVTETYFPYIASPFYNRRYEGIHSEPQYTTVCLDNYYDEIKKSFRSLNWFDMAMSLMSWAQYYDTTYSNPYNTLGTMNLGVSEETSEAYQNIVSYQASCPEKIRKKYSFPPTSSIVEKEQLNNLESSMNFCDSIKCIHRNNGNCTQYYEGLNIFDSNNNEEWSYQVESFIGYIEECIKDENSSNREMFLYDLLDYFNISHVLSSFSEDLFFKLFNYLKLRTRLKFTILDFLTSRTDYYSKEEKDTTNNNPSNNVEEVMLRWAMTGGQ